MINIFYPLLILALVLAALFTGSVICLISGIVLLVLLIVSVILVRQAGKKCMLELCAPRSADMGAEFEVILQIENGSIWPLGGIAFDLVRKNRLTKETDKTAFSTDCKSWKLKSDYCGCVEVSLENIRLKDWFGVFTCKRPKSVSCKTLIMPETFEVFVQNDFLSYTQNDTEEYSQEKKGQDKSETFQIRDYVKGDPLSSIHWKLSGKMGSLIVREPSLPVDHSLVIFWNRNKIKNDPLCTATLFEAMASVAGAFAQNGITYTFCWNDDSLNTFVVENESQYCECVALMLNAGDVSDKSGVELFNSRFDYNDIGRILVFNEGEKANTELFESAAAVQLFTCSRSALNNEEPQTVHFSPENVEDVINRVILGGE